MWLSAKRRCDTRQQEPVVRREGGEGGGGGGVLLRLMYRRTKSRSVGEEERNYISLPPRSLSFILVMASFGFILFTVFYTLCDIVRIWNGSPFRFPGMLPSIVCSIWCTQLVYILALDYIMVPRPIAWYPDLR